MPEDKKIGSKHRVIMDRRESISITGVLDVISFDEESIVSDTEMGILILKGVNLHVTRLNLEEGELEIDGEIESLNYEETGYLNKSKGFILGKIFK